MNKKIALVPLDSRPCNSRFPVKLALGSGYEIITPPKDIMDFYIKPADTQGILNWLVKAAADCGCMIVSADMLAYGGLIASRNSKTSLEEAINNLKALEKIKKGKPEIKIYLFSIITRLSTTASSDDSAMIWKKLFEASSAADNVTDLYKPGNGIPKDVIDDFVSARKRNLEINKLCVDLAAKGAVDFLILGKEDTAQRGLQVKEIKVLEEFINLNGCKDKVLITNGADEIGAVLVARRIVDEMPKKPRIAVRYSSKNIESTALYEDSSVEQNVLGHIKAVACPVVEKISDADLVLFVNMFEGKQKDLFFEKPVLKDRPQMHLLKNFCSEIAMAKDLDKKIAVADINYANGGDVQFVEALKAVFDLSRLDSYAGWNTASNSIGCAIAQAVLPASKEFLLERFIDDLGYQAIVRPKINDELAAGNISKYDLGDKKEETELRIQEKMNDWTHAFISNLQAAPCTLAFSLPWPRTFEIDCDIILQQ